MEHHSERRWNNAIWTVPRNQSEIVYWVNDTAKYETCQACYVDRVIGSKGNSQSVKPNCIRLRAAKERAEMLNDKGVKYNFKLGQSVTFYYPPSQQEAKSSGRKAKHFSHFRGPATIAAALSSTNTTFRLKYNDRYYERSVINIRLFRSNESPNLYEVQNIYEVNIGDLVGVIDAVEDESFCQTFHLSKVLDIADDKYTVWYLATSGRNIQTLNGNFCTATRELNWQLKYRVILIGWEQDTQLSYLTTTLLPRS